MHQKHFQSNWTISAGTISYFAIFPLNIMIKSQRHAEVRANTSIMRKILIRVTCSDPTDAETKRASDFVPLN